MENKTEKNFNGILSQLGKIFIFVVLFAMVIMVFINAIARYLFSTNYPIFEEFSRFAFVWTAFLGAMLAYNQGKHVGVDILTSKLRGMPKLIIQIIANLVVLGCLGVIGVGAWNYYLITAHTPAPSSGMPFGIVSAAGLVLTAWMLVITVRNIIRDIKTYQVKKGEKN